jgi:hypothetical protein
VGGGNELCGSDVGRRNAVFFEFDYVVRTARNTAPSIAEGFDDGVAFLAQLGVNLL